MDADAWQTQSKPWGVFENVFGIKSDHTRTLVDVAATEGGAQRTADGLNESAVVEYEVDGDSASGIYHQVYHDIAQVAYKGRRVEVIAIDTYEEVKE
ncbi:MAG TPA: hypothetical protein VLG27_01660 [Candidatus Saccharimonadia bacterium]|nr:hypothetical protein [Candidatus Saccharimonadia bacterium]